MNLRKVLVCCVLFFASSEAEFAKLFGSFGQMLDTGMSTVVGEVKKPASYLLPRYGKNDATIFDATKNTGNNILGQFRQALDKGVSTVVGGVQEPLSHLFRYEREHANDFAASNNLENNLPLLVKELEKNVKSLKALRAYAATTDADNNLRSMTQQLMKELNEYLKSFEETLDTNATSNKTATNDNGGATAEHTQENAPLEAPLKEGEE